MTLAGLALGLAGLLCWPSPQAMLLLGLSVGCDVADGALARRLRAVTEVGASLDWAVDVALAHVLGYRTFGVPATVVLVAVQVLLPLACWRVSGRTAVSAAAIFWQLKEVF